MRLPAARLLLRAALAASWIFLLFVGIIGGWPGWGAGRPPQSPSTKLQGSWSKKAPLLTKRSEVGIAALDGKIYVVGGATAGDQASALNQEYDPAADRWRDRASLPHGLSHPGVAGLNHKLYAFGGFSGGGVHVGALDLAFEYDPATDNWRQLAPLSSPRGSVGVAAVGGKIHAIGGRGLDKITVATHQIYDPSTGKWTEAAPLPKARDHMGVIVVDGKIHVIGGRTAGSGDNTNLHDVYDPATNSWRSAAPLLTARSSGAAAYYHGLVLYAGGECKDGKTFSENEAYDPKTNRWLALAPLPPGRHAFGAAAVGEYAYFAGGALGCGGGSLSDELLVFKLP
jgi:N-acetylneuraminic acid mutarotase